MSMWCNPSSAAHHSIEIIRLQTLEPLLYIWEQPHCEAARVLGNNAGQDGQGDARDQQQARYRGQSRRGGTGNPLQKQYVDFCLPQMNMDEVGDAIPETGGTDAAEKADPNAGERCPGLGRFC